MNEQEINVEIAEACGIQTVYYCAPYDCHGNPEKYITKTRKEADDWHWHDGDVYEFVDHSRFPDYCNDLNAMHEAEKLFYGEDGLNLDASRVNRYCSNLRDITTSICHANARQRAEAFLRTLGKWVY